MSPQLSTNGPGGVDPLGQDIMAATGQAPHHTVSGASFILGYKRSFSPLGQYTKRKCISIPVSRGLSHPIHSVPSSSVLLDPTLLYPHTPKPPRNLPSQDFSTSYRRRFNYGETGTQDPGLRRKTQMVKWGKVRGPAGAQAGPLCFWKLWRNLTPRPGPEPGWGGVNHLLGAGSEGREKRVRVSWRSSVFFGFCQPQAGEGERPEGGGWGWWKDPSLCLTSPRSWRLGGEGGNGGHPSQAKVSPCLLLGCARELGAHRDLGSEASQVRMWATVRSERGWKEEDRALLCRRDGTGPKHNHEDPLALNSLLPGPPRALYKNLTCALLFPPKPEMRWVSS